MNFSVEETDASEAELFLTVTPEQIDIGNPDKVGMIDTFFWIKCTWSDQEKESFYTIYVSPCQYNYNWKVTVINPLFWDLKIKLD